MVTLFTGITVSVGIVAFFFISWVTSVVFASSPEEQRGIRQNTSQNATLLEPATNPNPNAARGGGDISIVDGTAMMAESGVGGTIVDAEKKAHAGAISLYEVREGDTLSQIASMFGVSVNTIRWANDISTIKPGMQLVILPISGIQYTVQKGDTLATIAKSFDADAGEIAQFNGLEADATLSKGFALIIPNAETNPADEAKNAKAVASAKKATKKTGSTAVSSSAYYINPAPGSVLTQGVHGYNAVDLGAPIGTGVRASAGGSVIVSRGDGSWNGGYGNYVIISHDNGTQTLYSHLNTVSVSVGERLAQGDAIGTVGNTGKSTGPHLHFEVRGATNPLAR